MNKNKKYDYDYDYEYEDKPLTKEEEKIYNFNWKDRINYYINYPHYFLKVLWESIITFSWKI